MPYLLFFIYLAIFCWLITKIKFFKSAGLTNRTLIILFLLRVLASLGNGWINLFYYDGTDSSVFHQEGIIEYHLLFTDPKNYFTNIFDNYNKAAYTGMMDISESFWNNLKSNVIIKMLSLFNIFSRMHYFINALFYNFLIFFGSVALFRVFATLFPGKRILIFITCFLLPSTLYFTSGIHREGLVFLALCFVVYSIYQLINGRTDLKFFIATFLGLCLIFVLRSFVLIALTPALCSWLLCEKINKPKWLIFLTTYLLFLVIFFGIKLIFPPLDFPRIVVDRQAAFLDIAKRSNSEIPTSSLKPTIQSFLANAPGALRNVLYRPSLSENLNPLYIPLAIETTLYLIIIFFSLCFAWRVNKRPSIIVFSLFFAISMLLVIGYTIPVAGALVRYRSIYFPFLIIFMIHNLDMKLIYKAIDKIKI